MVGKRDMYAIIVYSRFSLIVSLLPLDVTKYLWINKKRVSFGVEFVTSLCDANIKDIKVNHRPDTVDPKRLQAPSSECFSFYNIKREFD